MSSGQSITNNSITKLQFDTAVYNAGGFFDTTTNFRFLPLYPGLYEFSIGVLYQVPSANISRGDAILQSAGGILRSNRNCSNTTSSNESMEWTAYAAMDGVSDYIEGATVQISGASQSIDNNTAYTYLYGRRVSNVL